MLPEELQAELARHATVPFDRGRMLPPEVYRSPDVLDVELDQIFGMDWLCVGRTADIPEAGDWFTAAVAHRSVLVARGHDQDIRAFDNACVHRGAPVAADGCGSAARFTCPYHAWSYGLDGQLLAAPYMTDSTEADGTPFDPANHRLGQLPVEVWEGFIFVCRDGDAPSLAPTLTGLTDVVGRYAMAGYVPVHNAVDVWATNWKLLAENFMDAYHVFKVHKASFGADGDNTRFTTMYPGTEHWAHHRVTNPADPDFCTDQNTTLTGDWRKTIVLAAVFPGFVIQLQPDWLWFLRITPLGTERCRIAWQVAVAPDVLDRQADRDAYVAELLDLIHLVNSEDQPIVESVRQNVEGPRFDRGPLSYLERNVYDFDRYLSMKLSSELGSKLSSELGSKPGAGNPD